MTPLLLLAAAASAELDALDQAVTRCDRGAANPVFASEVARRSQFLLDAYKEQEAIVSDRVSLTGQRRTLRETPLAKPTEQKVAEKQLDLQSAALDDRQKMLNDKRMLEAIRIDATDTMRRYFLNNCPAGKSDK